MATRTRKSLLEQVLELPAEERANFAYEVMKSLDDDREFSEESNKAYWQEVMRRIEAGLADEESGIPWEDVHREIREDLSRLRQELDQE